MSKSPRRKPGAFCFVRTDGREERIITVTPGFHLIALNARTGQPVPGFGDEGIVDMFKEIDDRDFPGDLIGQLGNSSPPVVAHDTIVVGAALPVGVRVNKENVKADVLAFDVRTGKRKWAFHTIPRKGAPGSETWQTGLDYTGNAGVWAPFSVDEELGYVYLPVEAPTNDVYGGHRHGDNLYSSSMVCVDIRTGERIWHFQHIHHDVWDKTALYKTTATDQAGKSSFRGIPPGDYLIFAWNYVEQGAFYNRDFLKSYEIKAAPVHIEPKSESTVSMEVIPRQP